MARIDDAVRRILRVKFRAGLFEHPYVDQSRQAEAAQMLGRDAVAAARGGRRARWCCCKNEGGALPLDPAKRTAVIGPLGDNQHDMLGPWWGRGDDEDAVTVFDGINAQNPDDDLRRGLQARRHGAAGQHAREECGSDAGFAAAVAAAQAADQVVLALGESREMSGEADSRSRSTCPASRRS